MSKRTRATLIVGFLLSAILVLACQGMNPAFTNKPYGPCPTPSATLRLSDGHTYTCTQGTWK